MTALIYSVRYVGSLFMHKLYFSNPKQGGLESQVAVRMSFSLASKWSGAIREWGLPDISYVWMGSSPLMLGQAQFDLLLSVTLWKTQCACAIYLTTTANARVFFFFFLKSEGTCSCILICFSDCISFGPEL